MPSDLIALFTFFSVPSAITGLLVWRLQKNISKREQERAERDADRREGDQLILKSVHASLDLSEATAYAVINGKSNGEMKRALEQAQQVKDAQEDFLDKQFVKHLH